MDAIVTARVPVELKEQGAEVLKSIGASPTELINSAYRFLLSEKRLPSAETEPGSLKPGRRRLSSAQKKKLSSALKTMNLGVISDDDFKDQLNAVRDERYAHTA